MTNPVGQDAVILGGNGFYQGLFYSATHSGFTVTSRMAEPKAVLGSSEPITRTEELASPPKQSHSAIFNCLEKAEEALIIFYMTVVVFLPSRNAICT
jgi:hypothetical protein